MSATLDGAPAEILRANYGFRAVAAPAGTHGIEMIYRPLACVAVRRRTPSLANGGQP